MSEPQYSINYSARRFGSTVVARGNVLIPVEDNTDYYTVATTANRNGRRSVAIALDYLGGNTTGGTVGIQQTGTISAELSGLPPGAASWARCSSTGTIERCTPSSSDDIIGYAEADGRVHLMFGMLNASIANGSSQSFNGTALETTDTPSADQSWAYDPVTGKYRADQPPPRGWCDVKSPRFGAKGDGVTDDSDAIEAAIQASGTEAPYGGTVFFPPGVYRISRPIDVTRAVILRGVSRGHHPVSKIKADALVTAIIIHTTETTPEVGGDGVFSGVRDLFIESTVSSIPVWQANETGITVGTKRRRTNDNRYYQEAVSVTTGICGATEPTWSNRLYNSSGLMPAQYNTVVDGGVTWQTKVHAGILMLRRAQISDVFVYSTTNSGICVNGSGYFALSNCNGATIERCRISLCGCGIEVGTDDGNVVTVSSCDLESCGYGQSGTGGFGIVDASFLGCLYINNQTALSTGPGFYTPAESGLGYSTWIGCYSESGSPGNKVKGIWLGGANGGMATDSYHTGYDPNNGIGVQYLGFWKKIGVKDASHPKRPHVWLDYPHGGVTFNARLSSDDELYGLLGDRYEDGSNVAGTWVTGIGPATGSFRRIVGHTNKVSPLGTGNLRIFQGEFRGNGANPYYLGVDADSKTDPHIRIQQGVGGHLKPGDRFEPGTAYNTGDFIGEVVTTEGWTSTRAWSGNFQCWTYMEYFDGRASQSAHPTTPNGYTYVCSKFGTTHASVEPTWPTSYLGSGGIVPYNWRNDMRLKVGDYVCPSTRNGHYYKVTAVTGADLNGYVAVGAVQPTWPTGGGSTVSLNGITYTEQGSDTGTYVADGTTEWQCVGPEPTFKNYGEIA